jgi:hypothetical protein
MLGQEMIVSLIGPSQRQSVEPIAEITAGFEPVGRGWASQVQPDLRATRCQFWCLCICYFSEYLFLLEFLVLFF